MGLADDMNKLANSKPELAYNERMAEIYFQEILENIKYKASTGKKTAIYKQGVHSEADKLTGPIGKIIWKKLYNEGFQICDYIGTDGLGVRIDW